jgi:hypothetical protein
MTLREKYPSYRLAKEAKVKNTHEVPGPVCSKYENKRQKEEIVQETKSRFNRV